jgi:transposase InsO family protein
VYPNLLKNTIVTGVNQVWASDITYIQLRHEHIYLAVILDLASRKCIRWDLGRSLGGQLDSRGAKKSADTIDSFRFDLWNYKSFPRQHWRRIRTTNGLERINKELKRRSRVLGAYSNDQSLLRVMVCIMMDINEDWITGNRYLSLEE